MATFVWAAAAGGNWSVGANWQVGGVAQAAPPTANDDVLIGSGTGATQQNITVDANSVCQSLDCTGYTGTFTINASITLSIGSGTPGPGNVALKFVSGMTFASGNSSTFFFVSTSATVQTVSFAGPTNINAQLRNVQFTGSGGSWQLTSALNNSSAGANITHTRGTLDTNGQTVSTSTFASSSGLTRTLTLGASSITVSASSSSSWGVTSGGLTLSNNTATVTVTGASGGFFSSSMNWVGLSIVFNGSGSQNINGPSGVFTCANLTRTGTAAKTDTFTYSGTNLVVTGALNITGSSTTSRILATSSVVANTTTWSAGSISLTNVDFMNVTATGLAANAAWTGTSLGDALGNTNITFDTPATQTWNGNTTGSWSTAANWTSRVPLPQDNVVINGLTSGTLTIDMPRVGASVDFTGSTAGHVTLAVSISIYGSWTYVSTLIVTGNFSFNFAGRGAYTITCAGIGPATSTSISAPGGTYTCLDNFVFQNSGAGLNVNNGTFDANGFNVTFFVLSSFGAGATIRMGSGIWSLTGTGSVWNANGSSILVPSTSTIKITNTSVTAKSFVGAGLTYNNLQINGAASAADVTITGANTFNNITGQANAHLTLTSSTTTTISSLASQGTAGNLFVLDASTSGTQATLSYAGSGVISVDFMSIKDIAALPTSRSVGVLIKMTSKSLTGTLTSSGVILSRAIVHRLTSSLTFTGNLIRSITRTAMTGTLSFTGTLLKKAVKPLTGNLTFTGNITKRDNKALSASLTFVGSLLRAIRHGLTASLTFVGSLRRKAVRTLTGSLSFSGTISRLTRRTLTASVSFVTSFVSFIPSRFRPIGVIVSSFTQTTTDSSRASVASPESRDNIETVQSKTNTESVDTNAQSSIVQSDSNERTVD
jgi:hypothetical protein